MRADADADPEARRVYAELGKRIAEARDRAKLSQSGLALKCGLARGSIANIERGRQHAPLHTIWKIGAALSVEPRMLLPTQYDLLEGVGRDDAERRVMKTKVDKMIAQSSNIRVFVSRAKREQK